MSNAFFERPILNSPYEYPARHWELGPDKQLASHGRWAFVEFTDVYAMQHDFAAKVQAAFDGMIEEATRPGGAA